VVFGQHDLLATLQSWLLVVCLLRRVRGWRSGIGALAGLAYFSKGNSAGVAGAGMAAKWACQWNSTPGPAAAENTGGKRGVLRVSSACVRRGSAYGFGGWVPDSPVRGAAPVWAEPNIRLRLVGTRPASAGPGSCGHRLCAASGALAWACWRQSLLASGVFVIEPRRAWFPCFSGPCWHSCLCPHWLGLGARYF